MSGRGDEVVTVPRALLRDACTRLYQDGDDMVREQLEPFAYPDDLHARVAIAVALPNHPPQPVNTPMAEYARGYNNALRSVRRVLGKPRPDDLPPLTPASAPVVSP